MLYFGSQFWVSSPYWSLISNFESVKGFIFSPVYALNFINWPFGTWVPILVDKGPYFIKIWVRIYKLACTLYFKMRCMVYMVYIENNLSSSQFPQTKTHSPLLLFYSNLKRVKRSEYLTWTLFQVGGGSKVRSNGTFRRGESPDPGRADRWISIFLWYLDIASKIQWQVDHNLTLDFKCRNNKIQWEVDLDLSLIFKYCK